MASKNWRARRKTPPTRKISSNQRAPASSVGQRTVFQCAVGGGLARLIRKGEIMSESASKKEKRKGWMTAILLLICASPGPTRGEDCTGTHQGCEVDAGSDGDVTDSDAEPATSGDIACCVIGDDDDDGDD